MQGVVTQCGHTLSSTKPHKIAFRPAPPPNLGQIGAASVGERDGSSGRKRGKMPESAISVLLRFMNRFINKHMCVCVQMHLPYVCVRGQCVSQTYRLEVAGTFNFE